METRNNKPNQPNSAQLSRLADTLFLSGTGFAAFGVWAIAKAFFLYWTNEEYFKGLYDNADDLYTLRVGSSILLLIVLLLRIYVARCARKESAALIDASDNRRPRTLYLFIAGVIAITYLASLPLEVYALMQSDADAFDTIPALIVELTCIYILFQLFSSAIQTLRYRKRQEQQHAN